MLKDEKAYEKKVREYVKKYASGLEHSKNDSG